MAADQEAGDDEEHVYPYEAPAYGGNSRMTERDGKNRHGSQAVDVGAVGSTWIEYGFCRHTYPLDSFMSHPSVGKIGPMTGRIRENNKIGSTRRERSPTTSGARVAVGEPPAVCPRR